MQTETTPVEGQAPGSANEPGSESGQPAAGGGEGGGGGGAAGTPAEGDGTPPASGTDGGDGTPPAGDGQPPADGSGDDPPALEFTVPEGVEITPEWQGELTSFAKTNSLSQEQVQAVVDMGVKFQQQVVDRMNASVAERVGQWAEQAKADPEIGGKDFEANVAVALEAVGKFGDAELKQLFLDYSLGNNPAMIRAFYRIGKSMREAGGVDGLGREAPAAPVNTEAARAERLYSQATPGKKRAAAT